MNGQSDTSVIAEIQKEFASIENRWLKLHYKTLIGLILFGFLLECVFGIILNTTGYVEISLDQYVLKYLLVPFLCNAVCIAAAIWAVHTPRLKQKARIYIISLLYVCICFVLFSVHVIFYAMYLIFAIPALLTVVYSDYRLTTITALGSIAAKVISELFVTWDPDKVYPLGDELGTANFAISLFILCIFYLVSMIVIRFEKQKNAAAMLKEFEHYQVQQRLVMDELTEVYNRKALRKAFQDMEEDVSGNTYTFVMADLDDFKLLNDTKGHPIGDQCLIEFAGILQKNCASGAVPFRFGGDEFCILLKNTAMGGVIMMCKSIQQDLKNSEAVASGTPVTVSFGIALYVKPMTPTQLLQNTDTALYRSKTSKDSICVYDGEKPSDRPV